MSTNLHASDVFPDFELPEHRKKSRRLSRFIEPNPMDEKLGFMDGYPVIQIFGRGSPKRLGTLCVVGHHTACAEIKGVRFSGLLAWMMWRAIYLSKLPGLERKVRVFVDWNIELFFPRDIVQTIEVD